MDNRINVDQVIQDSKKKEQLKFIIIPGIFIVILFSLWVFYFNKLENANWRGFFTVLLIILMVAMFVFGVVKLVDVNFKEKKYRSALTKYASLIEKVQIPESSSVIKCLQSGDGRFGFDTVNYHFWEDGKELVFYPVVPTYKTAKDYDLVQAVRLDGSMIRTFYITGDKYSVVKTANIENVNFNTDQPVSNTKKPKALVYKDTRATIISYAVGDQTVYLTFSLNLHPMLKKLLPDKEKEKVEQIEKQLEEKSKAEKDELEKKDKYQSDMEKLESLKENNQITEEEFKEQKEQLDKE